MPFFSVIIPTFNRCNFLKIAIDSVLRQTFKDFELIIVDDGSTDKTPNFIKTITDPRLRYIKQEHQGISFARNQGVLSSRSDVIAFLDTDDRFKQTKLETTYNYIKKFREVKIFHTEEIWYRNGKLLPPKIYHKKPDGLVFARALTLCCISTSTVVIKKEIFDDIGLFDENLPACEDYDFWLRATAKYPVKLIPEVLTLKEGGHSDQLSKKYPAMDKFRIYAINKLLTFGKLNKAQRGLAIEELRRKCTIYIKGAKKRGKTEDVKSYTRLINSYL